MRVNICLFGVGMDRKSLNAFQLCNRLAGRGHEVSLSATGEGHEHSWFPLAVKPIYVRPAPTSQRMMAAGGGRLTRCDLSLRRNIDLLASAIPECELNLCCDVHSWHAASRCGRGLAWLWVLDGPPHRRSPLWPRRALSSSGMERLKALFASEGLAEQLQTQRDAPSLILRPGIDLEIFHAAAGGTFHTGSSRAEERVKRVVCLGDEGEWSGLEVLERAVGTVLDTVPGCEFVLCGAKRPRGAGRGTLAFRHLASPQDYADLYREAVVVVGCYASGVLPLAPLEAMACGAPTVIAAYPDVGYAREGQNALLARHGDADSLAECIMRLLMDRELAATLRERAALDAAAHSWDRCADRLEELICSFLRPTADAKS